jgi:restriction endonuclease
MLANRLTGEPREIDVVLRATAAGHETMIVIEAASRRRKAAVDWVEQMIGKHKNLPTDNVVLVAEAGFTRQARKLALAAGMIPLTPESLRGPDPEARS